MALVAGWGFWYDPATGQKYADPNGQTRLDVTGSVNLIASDPAHNYITYTPSPTANRTSGQASGAYQSAPSPVVKPDTRNNPGAKAYIKAVLEEYGLGSLATWAWQKWLDGAEIDQILLEMRARPEYKARFPAMEILSKKMRAITEAEYIAYERTTAQLMRQVGLPVGFYDQPSDFTALIAGEVSITELSDRLTTYAMAAYSTPANDRAELERLYGIGPGDLIAFFIDPARAWPIIQKQWTASQIAGAAQRTGFGALTAPQAEQIGAYGTTEQDAEEAFGRLVAMREIFQPQTPAELAINEAEQLGAMFGMDVAAQEKIARQQQRRIAEFEAGGGFTATKEGFVGVGEAR